MCGIVGAVALTPEKAVDPAIARRMAEALRHRGPDGEGYFARPRIALGHRRLSVIDLDGGKQPLSLPGGRHTIVYNGEIFNYRELREELAREGQTFRTASDTEVVLAGFVRHGPAFLDRLEGMFAFLLYDDETGTLHAARDPFGIKPLYSLEAGDFLYFASELRAIRAVVPGSAVIDEESLETYLTCGYVPGRQTLLQGFFRISPGSVFTVPREGERREEPFSKRLLPETLAKSEPIDLRETLVRAVDRSLVADVPVGLYLSGGIDSSLIASIVRRDLDRKLDAFMVAFRDDPAFDETPHAEAVAKILDLPLQRIDCSPEDFEDFGSLARSLEEPMVDPSAVPLGRLASLTSKSLKVVLSGEGGDELFGGYHRYFWDRFVTRYREVPWIIRTALESAAALGGTRLKRRGQKLRETIGLDRSARYLSWFSPFREAEREGLLVRGPRSHRAETLFARAFASAAPLSETSQVQWVDLVTFLRDDLLAKADKMSMAHGLEVRVPFLQSSVAQAAFSIPDRARLTARETKRPLRALLRNYLPPSIVDRKKQGFEVPLGRWFRGRLRPVLDRYLSEEAIRNRGLLRWEMVSAIRAEHERGVDRGPALFALVLLEAWCQEHL